MSSGDPGGGKPPRIVAERKPPDPDGTGGTDRQEVKSREELAAEGYVPETPPEIWDLPGGEDWEDPNEEKANVPSGQDIQDEMISSPSSGDKDNVAARNEIKVTVGRKINQEEVHPKEIFTALLTEVREAASGPPRETWKKTTAELFALTHARVKIKKELVSKEKHRYPKLKEDEMGLLYQLFEEACIAGLKPYKEWVILVTDIIQDLYNTSWAFKNIVRSKISKIKWARVPVLNQWAGKIKQGTKDQGTPESAKESGPRYEQVMFKPGVYSKDEVAKFKDICAAPAGARAGRRLRQPTDEEWKIMSGLVHGTIVCRHLPDFLKSVLGAQERLRLYRTVQKQVEGELVLKLRSGMGVKASRQNTRALKEDMLLSAEHCKVNLAELHHLLNSTKTISYNHAQQSIHFFFFDRTTPKKFELVMVPYKGRVYKVKNVHGPDTGSVWDRQLDRYGVRTGDSSIYEVKLYNITRFMDIGRLAAYFQEHIKADVELEDIDVCTPNSRSSTTWRLTIKAAGCPEFLRGVVRIMWFGLPIVLKHSSTGQRVQCLRCGNVGHVLARCTYTAAELFGPGSRVAKETDIAVLEDVAKPFANLDEMRDSAAQRLHVQETEDKHSQDAVTPSINSSKGRQSEPNHNQQVPGTESDQEKLMASSSSISNKKKHPVLVEPKPKGEWVTVPLAGGRKLYGHEKTLLQKKVKLATRFDELASDSEPEDEEELNEHEGESKPEISVIDLQSSQEEKPKPTISEKDKAKLHLVARKPPKTPSVPVLLTFKQRERGVLEKTLLPVSEHAAGYAVLEHAREISTDGFDEIETNLGIKEVNTPSTGNCMAMALAQAVANHDLAAHDDVLEGATASIKRGIKLSGQMNMAEQYGHYERTMTLINVNRGWTGMSPQDSKKQFKWFLEEYAATPSSREAWVDRHNWGSSELMAMAANFLQRGIFVMGYNAACGSEWNCIFYRPSTTTHHSKTYETGQQIMLTVQECIQHIRMEKCKKQRPPIVLRFWGNHYSAFVHKMQAMRHHKGNDQVSAETTDGENIREEGSDQDMENQDDSLSSDENGKSQDPWNPSLWSGNITELHQQLEGLTIPHDLKKEIYHILHEAPEGRYAELLAFLVNTASQLSRNERDRLLDSQLDDPSDPAVIELLQKYNIPMVVLEQWKAMAALERQDSQQGEVDQHENNNMVSEDEFIPSSAQSVDEQGTTRELTIRTRSMSSNQKRQHSTTPTEAEQIRQSVRSRLETEQHSNVSEEMIVDTNPPIRGFSRPDWPHMWVSLATEWPTDSSRHFPRPGTSQEEWEATAIQEPERLMELLQKFPFPQEIMMILSGKVLVAWTAKWRRECLFTGLQGYKERTTDSGVKAWLTEWLSRFPQSISTTLAPLVDMRDDWTKLKGYSYGKDVVLKLCDVAHRGRLAQHLLCAMPYSQEIRVLLDHNEENEDGIAGNLRRHLQALHKDKRYSEVYYASKQQLDWIGIAQFFASVFEQGEQSVEYQQTRQ